MCWEGLRTAGKQYHTCGRQTMFLFYLRVVAVPNRTRIFILLLTSSASSCLQYSSLKLHWVVLIFTLLLFMCYMNHVWTPPWSWVIQHFEHCNACKNTTIRDWHSSFQRGFTPHVVTQLTNEVWRAGRLVWATYYHHVQAQLMKPACSTYIHFSNHLYCTECKLKNRNEGGAGNEASSNM